MKHGEKECLAIIGIRAGSKGVKNKNIKLFCGKPLVYWIINAAQKSKYVNRVIISTDSKKYADICKSFGAEVLFLRPENISTDESLELEYIMHALDWLKNNEQYKPHFVTRLQATSPLQLPEDIDRSIEVLIKDNRANSSMVVFKSSFLPHKALTVDADNLYLQPYLDHEDNLEIKNRQIFKNVFYRGNIITSRFSDLIETRKQVGKYSRFIEIPEERGIDINSQLDFFIGELIAKKLKICNS